MIKCARVVGDGILRSDELTTARVNVRRGDNPEEVLERGKGCRLVRAQNHTRTFVCRLEAEIQGLGNGREERSERKLVDDVRYVHDWSQRW